MRESSTVAAPSQLLECPDQNGIVAEDVSTLSSPDSEDGSHWRGPRQQVELFPMVQHALRGSTGPRGFRQYSVLLRRRELSRCAESVSVAILRLIAASYRRRSRGFPCVVL